MTNSLLIAAWPYGDNIYTSFRYATGYAMPDVYTGNATLTQISSTINSTSFTLIFRCQNCLSWNQDGSSGGASTSSGALILGWCQAFPSPGNPTCPDQITIEQHDNGQGIWGAQLDSNAANPSYTAWAAKATKTVPAQCSGPTSTGVVGVPVPTGATYDYIVVGAGAGGIPIADKLSEAGKSVLLIEKGFASTGQNGGTLGPDWLAGTGLTRFDVPGLCNEIWVDSKGIACDDTDQMAGCVLGGGTAVNAGLWFHVSSTTLRPLMTWLYFSLLSADKTSPTRSTSTTCSLPAGSRATSRPPSPGCSRASRAPTRLRWTASFTTSRAST
jgi:cellobiose dehydrogenase (acceptor)